MKKLILARDGESLAAAFIVHSPFPLDPFQLEAIGHLEADKSVLVAAPTSAGKTVIAEFAIERALESGQHVIYTAPIKALSNQKFADFGRRWGFERVGLLTGDIAINKNAPVRVMTTEVLRNMLLQAPDGVRDVQTVVLDEFHYLADPERGRVWEEIVILLPSDVQLVCLSASMANATQLREWMSRVHGETALVTHPLRPVPLEVHYFAHGVLQLVVDAQGRQVRALRVGGEERRSRRRWSGTGSPARAGDQARAKAPIAVDVIAELRDRHLLPAIYFVFNRARTESEAALCEGSLDLVTHQEARNIIQQAVAETAAQLPPEAHVLPQVRTLFNLLTRGIAFHHAGLLPALKVLVENLFSQGVLGVVFATETLALGINMPARSVVIPQLTKFDGSTRRPLSGREFQQLIGRAGRRGMDIAGHAVLVHDPMMTFDEAMTIVRRPLEPVMSSFSLTYNSLTNLLLTYGDPQVLARLMNRSLLAFQLVIRRRRFEIQLSKLQQQLLDIPIQCPACGHAQPATHCPRYREHVREARQRRQLLFHITELEQEVERAKTMEQRDLHHTVEDALAVLTHFGYVKDGTCTDDGEVLA
ncbi:MAG: DEAD/DEAH box helicase, partial [Chloroflexi bacterium]|nr:DEAD/DEAH box helicase [Chloroflexota bacterium]